MASESGRTEFSLGTIQCGVVSHLACEGRRIQFCRLRAEVHGTEIHFDGFVVRTYRDLKKVLGNLTCEPNLESINLVQLIYFVE